MTLLPVSALCDNVTLTFDFLTSEVVRELHVIWATVIQSIVRFLLRSQVNGRHLTDSVYTVRTATSYRVVYIITSNKTALW